MSDSCNEIHNHDLCHDHIHCRDFHGYGHSLHTACHSSSDNFQLNDSCHLSGHRDSHGETWCQNHEHTTHGHTTHGHTTHGHTTHGHTTHGHTTHGHTTHGHTTHEHTCVTGRDLLITGAKCFIKTATVTSVATGSPPVGLAFGLAHANSCVAKAIISDAYTHHSDGSTLSRTMHTITNSVIDMGHSKSWLKK